jgi:hypothetical protein
MHWASYRIWDHDINWEEKGRENTWKQMDSQFSQFGSEGQFLEFDDDDDAF